LQRLEGEGARSVLAYGGADFRDLDPGAPGRRLIGDNRLAWDDEGRLSITRRFERICRAVSVAKSLFGGEGSVPRSYDGSGHVTVQKTRLPFSRTPGAAPRCLADWPERRDEGRGGGIFHWRILGE